MRSATAYATSSAATVELLERIHATLEEGKCARTMELDEDELELLGDTQLLTMKPVIYVANVSENEADHEPLDNPLYCELKEFAAAEHSEIIAICAQIEAEISAIHEACGGKILKVIIETCLLTEEEKIKMCEIVTASGADFIKTSTGFSTAGATFADVELFAKYVGENVKIKAAGGISSMDDAEKFMELGASRLGTSRIVKIVKNEEASGY